MELLNAIDIVFESVVQVSAWADRSILKQVTASTIGNSCFGKTGIALHTAAPVGGLSC